MDASRSGVSGGGIQFDPGDPLDAVGELRNWRFA